MRGTFLGSRSAVMTVVMAMLALSAVVTAFADEQLCANVQTLKRAAPGDFEEIPASPDLFGSMPDTYITRFAPVAVRETSYEATIFPDTDGVYLYECMWTYGYGLAEQARSAADAAMLAGEIKKCLGGVLESHVDANDKSVVTYQAFPDGRPDGTSRKAIFTIQANPRLSLSRPLRPDPSRQGILSLLVEARK